MSAARFCQSAGVCLSHCSAGLARKTFGCGGVFWELRRRSRRSSRRCSSMVTGDRSSLLMAPASACLGLITTYPWLAQ
jgi:hypothetical protein